MAGRNYAIDVLKLGLMGLIFIYHTYDFMEDNTWLRERFFPNGLGWISVHIFFAISGFLMMKSYFRDAEKTPPETSGRNTARFVFRKFTGIAPQYYTALVISWAVYIASMREQLSLGFLSSLSYNLLPEALLLNRGGMDPVFTNLPTWYIQAMLLCMIPMYYLLSRNRDLFMYVITPLGGLFALAFMFNQDPMFIGNGGTEHIIPNGMIRGFAGLFSGCIAFVLYRQITKYRYTRLQKTLLTVLEAVIYIWMLMGCFTAHSDSKGHFLAMLLIVPALALTFSGESWLAVLFSSPKLKFVSSLTTTIYFNHWSARRIVMTWFPGMSYKRSVAYMAAFTVVLCIVYWLILTVCRKLAGGCLKKLFTFTPKMSSKKLPE